MSLQSKTIDNDIKFRKTVKPLFGTKNPMSEKITLTEDGKILSNDMEVAECFNEYFCNITDSLDIDPRFNKVQEQMAVDKMVLRAISKHKDHPFVKAIKHHLATNGDTFRFSHVCPNEVMRPIDLLDKNKCEYSNWCVKGNEGNSLPLPNRLYQFCNL